MRTNDNHPDTAAEQPTIRLSVKNLVENTLRSGDLSLSANPGSRTLGSEGIRAQKELQKDRPPDYRREINLSFEKKFSNFTLILQGRMDGLYRVGEETIIEEIKATRQDFSTISSRQTDFHWGQLKVYAYLFAREKGLKRITCRLTRINLNSSEVKEEFHNFLFTELKFFFEEIMRICHDWHQSIIEDSSNRYLNNRFVPFPLESYRPGQKRMALDVYYAIADQQQQFIQAPTGIGKTMAALFPACRALSEGKTDKIFYLTARTTGRIAAEKSIRQLSDGGFKLKALSLTAKEKICFKPGHQCNAEECEFAKGYYDRLGDALPALFEIDIFTSETVRRLAEDHRLCPFELSLDLSLWMDCIIADFNYAFDPGVALKRFFMEVSGRYTFLIDEAHNLVDRARGMFSAAVEKDDYLQLRRRLKEKSPAIYRASTSLNHGFLRLRRGTVGKSGKSSTTELPGSLIRLLRRFLQKVDLAIRTNPSLMASELLRDTYHKSQTFIRIAELYDQNYASLYSSEKRSMKVKLFCINPSEQLRIVLKKCRSAVFFSATLTPVNYFRNLLGCSDTLRLRTLGSPFPAPNRRSIIRPDISTLYRRRQDSLASLSRTITSITSSSPGNYLVFFPSHRYMNLSYSHFETSSNGFTLIKQDAEMSEGARLDFLDQFKRERVGTLVGFAVLGGIFAEAIDLTGNQLCCAVIVGVGLPGISLERKLIQEYFEKSIGQGYDFAFLFPGVTRIFQAAGRVIRSETDRGVIIFIDERYIQARYQRLFPPEWKAEVARDDLQMERSLSEFWQAEPKDS